jgi:FkbM family methyltransferase
MKPAKTLDANAPQKTSYCVPSLIRDQNIRANCQLVKDRVEPGEPRTDKIALVGYGPSLNQTWEQLKDFDYIITCSGAHKFLLEKGITPTFHLDVDPRSHKKELIGTPNKETEYLMASAVHPDVIKHLLDHGSKVKLWHIFAQDGESEQVLPRGEWSITGGCDAGMRCATVARFMGFTDMHIFGMDACEGETGKHAGEHPNQAKDHYETTVNDKVFRTTPAWISCAQQWFKELDQLGDVTAQFYGEGLIQEMAKNYKRNPIKGNLIAFNKPTLISDEMKEMNAQLHRDNPYYGVGGHKYAATALELAQKLTKEGEHPVSLLDYGAGKGLLAKELPFPIFEYDPAIPGKDEPPRSADIVICTDVLEHVEPELLDVVLDDLRRVTKQVGYFVIHMGPAKKHYSDGRNAHLIQEGVYWWTEKLKTFFTLGQVIEQGHELHVVVAPFKNKDVTKVENAKFYTPNDTTRWRAKTLLTKEPITIQWIESMQEGEILFDVGANVGGYSVWAGLRGIKVFSFEPEAENFAILTRNLAMNGLAPNAYPIAISDKSGFDTLHLSSFGGGGSCHSFRESLKFDGTPKESQFQQGSIGIALDAIKGQLPQPDHIKIDVDGLEWNVIKGAIDTLKGVKSLLIEVNPKIPRHLELIDILKVLGFTYDEKQAEDARRKSGPFEGVGEIIFTRPEVSEVERHFIECIEKAKLISKPYPHLILENVFPQEYYDSILSEDIQYKPIKEVRNTDYPARFVGMKEFPELRTKNIRDALMKKFGVEGDVYDETLLIRDLTHYAIGPHTDLKQRVLSAIFYLAKDDENPELGTSVYTPLKKGFKSDGKKHFKFDEFKKVKTAPYKPNSAFIFLRTDNSFHGVEPTEKERNVLLYDLRHR